MTALETATWRCHVTVDKWGEDATQWVERKSGLLAPDAATFEKLGVTPDETDEGPTPGNRLVTVGLDALTGPLILPARWVWDQTHWGIGVGDVSTADAIGDADLGGATKCYQGNDAAFPTQANGVLTLKATF